MTESSHCFPREMSSFKIMLQKVGFGSDRTNIPEEQKEDNGSIVGKLLAEKEGTPENPAKSDTNSMCKSVASDEEIETIYTVPPPSVQHQESKRSAPAYHSGDTGIEFRERKRKRKKLKKKVPMETPPPDIDCTG